MAQSEAHNALDRYDFIPLVMLDEPMTPERETMEPEELAELAASIATVGLINPLTVKLMGDRYEVTGGHRRLLACRMVDLDPVPCIIKSREGADPLAIMVAENAHREEVNPVEEARFYRNVLEALCNNDVDLLCTRVRRRREFVEDRLLLLQGDPRVVDALHQKKISLAVARELNKVKGPNQLMLLLDTSVRQGATARQVAEWRREYDGQEDFHITEVNMDNYTLVTTTIPVDPTQQCFFCGDAEDAHEMQIVRMHKPCKKMVTKALGLVTDNESQQAT